MAQGIERFLDEEGRVKLWPAKQAPREEVFAYLVEKFEPDHNYTEHCLGVTARCAAST